MYEREGQLNDAVAALERARDFDDPPPPPWTYEWLSGVVNAQQGNLEQAQQSLQSVLQTKVPSRKFDFSRDYLIMGRLGRVLLDLSQRRTGQEQIDTLHQAVGVLERALEIDSENVNAHFNLQIAHRQLEQIYRAQANAARAAGDEADATAWEEQLDGEIRLARYHRERYLAYKPDDAIAGRVTGPARERYPAADHAAETVVIYDLRRPGAPRITRTRSVTCHPNRLESAQLSFGERDSKHSSNGAGMLQTRARHPYCCAEQEITDRMRELPRSHQSHESLNVRSLGLCCNTFPWNPANFNCLHPQQQRERSITFASILANSVAFLRFTLA